LVQAFLKKWWVESDFKAPNLPLSLRFKESKPYKVGGNKTDHHDIAEILLKVALKTIIHKPKFRKLKETF
jgi:hypothetical protein